MPPDQAPLESLPSTVYRIGELTRHVGLSDPAFVEGQRVVCFSETPLDYLSWLVNPGISRRNEYEGYGVAFTREFLLHAGASPIWYINQVASRSGFRWLVHEVNDLIDEAAMPDGRADPEQFANSAIARLTPFIESIWKWSKPGRKTEVKDFAFEREWRFLGDFSFELADVAYVIVPTGRRERVERTLVRHGLTAGEARRLTYFDVRTPES